MHSGEGRLRAIELLIEYDFSPQAVINAVCAPAFAGYSMRAADAMVIAAPIPP